MIVEQRIRDYLHSLEPDQGDLLEEISRKAIRDEVPIIKKETGALLKTMVAAKRPRAILEVGTAVGYSALLMAGVMPGSRWQRQISNGPDKRRGSLCWRGMRRRF